MDEIEFRNMQMEVSSLLDKLASNDQYGRILRSMLRMIRYTDERVTEIVEAEDDDE